MVLRVGGELGVGVVSGSSSVVEAQALRIKSRIRTDLQSIVTFSGSQIDLLRCLEKLEWALRISKPLQALDITDAIISAGFVRKVHLEYLLAAAVVSGNKDVENDAIARVNQCGLQLLDLRWHTIVNLCINHGGLECIERLFLGIPPETIATSERVAVSILSRVAEFGATRLAEQIYGAANCLTHNANILIQLARCYAVTGTTPPKFHRFECAGSESQVEKIKTWLAISLHKSGNSTDALSLLGTLGRSRSAFTLTSRCSIAFALGDQVLADELQLIFSDLAASEQEIMFAFIRLGLVLLRDSELNRNEVILMLVESYRTQLQHHRSPRVILGDLLRTQPHPGSALLLAFAPKLLRLDEIEISDEFGENWDREKFEHDAKFAIGLSPRRIRGQITRSAIRDI
jgi:hypothetical protein